MIMIKLNKNLSSTVARKRHEKTNVSVSSQDHSEIQLNS